MEFYQNSTIVLDIDILEDHTREAQESISKEERIFAPGCVGGRVAPPFLLLRAFSHAAHLRPSSSSSPSTSSRRDATGGGLIIRISPYFWKRSARMGREADRSRYRGDDVSSTSVARGPPRIAHIPRGCFTQNFGIKSGLSVSSQPPIQDRFFPSAR